MEKLIQKYEDNVTGTVSGFDRLVFRGNLLINGFRNRDLRDILFTAEELDGKIKKRRKSSVITRKIRLLRGHGLVEKVPKTHRYLLTDKGREVISALQTARNADVNSLLKLAA